MLHLSNCYIELEIGNWNTKFVVQNCIGNRNAVRKLRSEQIGDESEKTKLSELLDSTGLMNARSSPNTNLEWMAMNQSNK